MKESIKLKEYKVLDTSVIIFMLFPFLFLAYIYFIGSGDIIGFISKNPKVTISFIGAMIVPFVGIGLKNIKKMLINEKLDVALVSLILLLLSQIFFFNIIGIVAIGFLSFKIGKSRGIRIKGIGEKVKGEYSFFIFNGIILLLSVMCFMLSYRL